MNTTIAVQSQCTDEFVSVPDYLVFEVDQALCNRVRTLQRLVKRHGLSEAVINIPIVPGMELEDAVDGFGDGLTGGKGYAVVNPSEVVQPDDDLRVDCTELVVYGPNATDFGLRCYVRNTDIRVGSELMDIREVLAFKPAEEAA